MKHEQRNNEASLLRVREERNAEGSLVSTRTVEGVAIVFGQPSVVMDEWGEPFREIIDPTCVTREFLDTCDVKMTLFHNRESIVARYMPGRDDNSLRLQVLDDGVHFAFEAPVTGEGDKLLEGIRRGDLTGCSFTFVPDWEQTQYEYDAREGVTVVRHTKFRWLGEMTIGTDPAYPQTSVSTREAYGRTAYAASAQLQRETAWTGARIRRETQML